MKEIFVGKIDEFTDDNVRKIITVKQKEIGVFFRGNQFFAFENVCPHAGGPACEGVIRGKVKALLNEEKDLVIHQIDETVANLVCPWHGWEFNLTTGECAADRKYKLRKYEIIEKGEAVYLQYD